MCIKQKLIFFISFFILSNTILLAQDDPSECKQYPKDAKTVLKKKLGKRYDSLVRLKEEGDIDSDYLTDSEFKNLSSYESFVYCLLFPEMFSQNCSVEEELDEEKYWDQNAESKAIKPELRVYGYISTYDDFSLSDRQLEKLKRNRSQIVQYIKQNVEGKRYIPCNYKNILIQINAIESIPWLISFFNNNSNKKDKDILTVLCSLMYDNKYKPFMESKSCAKMYLNLKRTDYIEFNSANIKLTFERAMAFYNSRYK
jgi:hypothetical protein